jgi:hypothetical protein
MLSKEWIKLIVSIFIVLGLYALYHIIMSNIKKQLPPSSTGVIVPFQTSQKPICAYTRTSCETSEDCINKCNDSNRNQLVCTDVNKLQPDTTNINGGGKICLPPVPIVSCNVTNGGALLWTGYGSTNQQGWDCLCTQPTIWNGLSCDIKNPSYCSGGTLDSKFNCSCPDNTVKMWRNGLNTPFCAPKSGEKGGMYGLAGNRLDVPNWGNVFFNLDTADYSNWATRIAEEMNISDNNDAIVAIKKILEPIMITPNTNTPNPITPPPLYQLTEGIINNICNDPTVTSARNGIDWATKMCSANKAGRENGENGKPTYLSANEYVTYTYYDKAVYNL